MLQNQLGFFEAELRGELVLRSIADNEHRAASVFAFQDFRHVGILLYEMCFIKLDAKCRKIFTLKNRRKAVEMHKACEITDGFEEQISPKRGLTQTSPE